MTDLNGFVLIGGGSSRRPLNCVNKPHCPQVQGAPGIYIHKSIMIPVSLLPFHSVSFLHVLFSSDYVKRTHERPLFLISIRMSDVDGQHGWMSFRMDSYGIDASLLILVTIAASTVSRSSR